MMSPSLPLLPSEILEMIANRSNLANLRSLRSTCRDVNQQTLNSFGRQGFSRVRTDLSRSSIEQLQAISDVPVLRKSVQVLLVEWTRYNGLGREYQWHRKHQTPGPGPINTERSIGAQAFRTVLTRISNCRSFHFEGWGGDDFALERGELLPADAIGLVLAFLADTGRPTRSLRIGIVHWGKAKAVEVAKLRLLPAELCTAPRFQAVWASLEELGFQFGLAPGNYDWARAVFLHATSLRRFEMWLTLKPNDELFQSIFMEPWLFQGLQELRLGYSCIPEAILSEILRRCASTLRLFFAQNVGLAFGQWERILLRLKSCSRLERLRLTALYRPFANMGKNEFMDFPQLRSLGNIPNTYDGLFEVEVNRQVPWTRMVACSRREGMQQALEMLVNGLSWVDWIMSMEEIEILHRLHL